MNRTPRIFSHTTIVQLMVFLLSPHRHLRPVPSTRRSGTNASTPTAKRTFACGGLSVGGLTAQHPPLQLPCPGALIDFFGIRNRYQFLQMKLHHLKNIGICFKGHQLIIEYAPSLERLFLHYCYKPSQITVVSAPKLETLGVIRDPFNDHRKLVFRSSLFQVSYIIIYTFVIISCIFHLCA